MRSGRDGSNVTPLHPEGFDPPKFIVLAGDEVLKEGTYFVVRDTDILATPFLWGYVHQIQTLLELDRQRDFHLSEQERVSLSQLEDYVSDLAADWQAQGKGRIPD